jgi:hypothetical protein
MPLMIPLIIISFGPGRFVGGCGAMHAHCGKVFMNLISSAFRPRKKILARPRTICTQRCT